VGPAQALLDAVNENDEDAAARRRTWRASAGSLLNRKDVALALQVQRRGPFALPAGIQLAALILQTDAKALAPGAARRA
jgi:hypothetical protein